MVILINCTFLFFFYNNLVTEMYEIVAMSPGLFYSTVCRLPTVHEIPGSISLHPPQTPMPVRPEQWCVGLRKVFSLFILNEYTCFFCRVFNTVIHILIFRWKIHQLLALQR